MENQFVSPSLSLALPGNHEPEAYSRLARFELWLQGYLGANAPVQLPPAHREKGPTYLAWFTLLGVVLLFFLQLVTGALAVLLAPASLMVSPLYFVGYVMSFLGMAALWVLMAMSVPGLFRRSKRGWLLFFYGELVGLCWAVLTLDVLFALIGAFVLYIAFQIKSAYR